MEEVAAVLGLAVSAQEKTGKIAVLVPGDEVAKRKGWQQFRGRARGTKVVEIAEGEPAVMTIRSKRDASKGEEGLGNWQAAARLQMEVWWF
jgi:hypothetical protein